MTRRGLMPWSFGHGPRRIDARGQTDKFHEEASVAHVQYSASPQAALRHTAAVLLLLAILTKAQLHDPGIE